MKMKTIPRPLLGQLSCGVAAALGGTSSAAWDGGGWGDWGGGGGGGFDFGGGGWGFDSFSGGGGGGFDSWGGGDNFGSVSVGGFNLGLGSFDLGGVASDVGGSAYTPAVPNGLFNMSIAENLGVLTAAGAVLNGLGQGWGASAAIQAAGGFSQLGTLGAAATGVGGAALYGIGSAAAVGAGVGTLIYHYSPDWAQTIMQDAVGGTVEAIKSIPEGLAEIGAWIGNVTLPSGAGHGMVR
jgi:hypothetical protein